MLAAALHLTDEHLLCARSRPSNLDASTGALEDGQRLVAQLRAVWPAVRIILRVDSGFCRDALMTCCDAHAVDYVSGLTKNARLIALITDELAEAAATCTETKQPARAFAERTYQTLDSWTCARRVVDKAEQLTLVTAEGAGKSNPRFLVTSRAIADVDARTLYEDVHCARGEMENRIEEQLELMLVADRTSAATLRANQLRLCFSSVAYVLLAALRRLGLAGTALAKPQCTTIRLTLLKIGARIRVTVRKVWLALASAVRTPHSSRRCTPTCENGEATSLIPGARSARCDGGAASRGRQRHDAGMARATHRFLSEKPVALASRTNAPHRIAPHFSLLRASHHQRHPDSDPW